jgi:NAD(P)-dependent dehydrogenase (short-subunit alcohol dehydrogenase family)
MKNLFDIKGKVAIVTGGSRGIGAMIAKGYVENGVRTYISARKKHELAETEQQLSELGECIGIAADLSSLEGIEAFVTAIKAREETIDILVNNAGAAWGEDILSFPESGWDKVMDINLKAPFFLTQQLQPLLKRAGSRATPSRIINISSIHGLISPSLPTYSYSASKAGMIQLTRHLAVAMATDNIRVNGIAPGFFPSKMTAFALAEEGEAIGAKNLLGRIGEPEDIAGAAIYLASRASAWMTGHTLVLDGGEVASAGAV